MIVSPGSKVISRPSSLNVGIWLLPIALATDHVHRAERRNDVGDHVAANHVFRGFEVDETRWTTAHPVRCAAAIRNDIKSELAVAAFGVAVHRTCGRFDAFH